MMRRRIAVLALLVPLLPVPAFADWMTFVGRKVGTGERLGLGARVSNENEDPMLAISCTPDGLTATFDTGFVAPVGERLRLPDALLVGADGGAFDPFPVSLEPFTRGEQAEMRMRLDASEATGLAEYVLGATRTIQVGYTLNGKDVVTDFPAASAPMTVGAVLSECAGHKVKSKKGDRG